MKNKNILVALLSCSYACVSFTSEMYTQIFNEADHGQAASAHAVTPEEQKTADKIAKDQDAAQNQNDGKKAKNKKAKKAHNKKEKHQKHVKHARHENHE